jgi:hypothetical protein
MRDDQILQLPRQIVKLASVFSRSSSGSVPMHQEDIHIYMCVKND